VKLFSASCRSCHIDRLQPQVFNRHGVFLVTESEALTYHYDLDLRSAVARPDPRVSHAMNLTIDELGRILGSVTVSYPRFDPAPDGALPVSARPLAAEVQAEIHAAYNQTAFTRELDDRVYPDVHRLGQPCTMHTFDVTGLESLLDARGYLAIEAVRAAGLRNLV